MKKWLLIITTIILLTGCPELFYRDLFTGNTTTAYVIDGPVGKQIRDNEASYFIKSVPVYISNTNKYFLAGPEAFLVDSDSENIMKNDRYYIYVPCKNISDEPRIGIFGPRLNYIDSNNEAHPFGDNMFIIGFSGCVRMSSTLTTGYTDGLGVGETGYFITSVRHSSLSPDHITGIRFDIDNKTDFKTVAREAPRIFAESYDYTQNGSETVYDRLSITVRNSSGERGYIKDVTYIVMDDNNRPLYTNFINFMSYIPSGGTLTVADDEFLFCGTGTKIWTAAWVQYDE